MGRADRAGAEILRAARKQDGFELELTGFATDEIERLFGSESGAAEDDFNADENIPETPVSQHGDIWQLGRHRLMCGDSTDEAELSELMGEVKTDLYLSDPPYNVNYEGTAGRIRNDNMGDAEFRAFLSKAFGNFKRHLKEGGCFYIFHADSEGYNFRGACVDAGLKVRQCLIWEKNTFVLGRQDYQWQHEPVLYGWKDGANHLWASDRKQKTVVKFDKPSRNGEHPTMKPVSLVGYLIGNNTKGDDVVLDTFGGSGSTLIACEQLKRICYMAELEPKYCDVIVRRYIKFVDGSGEVFLVRGGKRTPYGGAAGNAGI